MTVLRKPVTRRTNTPLGAGYGPDRHKHIVVTIAPGNGRDVPDVLELRPERTRRTETITVEDVYRIALQGRVRGAQLAKARETKQRKQAARDRRRLNSAERRLTRPIS